MIKELNQTECIELLQNHYIGRLAYMVGESPFVVPITFYYHDLNDSSIISYALEGHKIDAMRNNARVALLVDEIESVNRWKSVMAHGTFEELSSIDAKNLLHEFSQGVKNIINRDPERKIQFIHEFSSKLGALGSSPIVYRIKIHEITGKVRKG